jgi:nitrite reductase/ring-hydroxylating ferredoxin subunit
MAARERLICTSGELVEGGEGVRFETDWQGATEPAFAIRYGGRVYAYLNRCAHVPIEIDWQPGKFFDFTGLYLVCAVHGALYDPQSGACLGGR